MKRKSGEIMEEERKKSEAFRAVSLVVRDENSEEVTLHILEETRLNGCSYTLTVDSEEADEDDVHYLLKDASGADDAETVYEFVEDEEEAGYMFEIFQTILENEGADIDLLDE